MDPVCCLVCLLKLLLAFLVQTAADGFKVLALVKPAQVPCELEAPRGCGTGSGEGSRGSGPLGGLSLGHGAPPWG